MTKTSETLHEVMIIADEPWHAGIRRALNEAVLDYVESDLTLARYEEAISEEPEVNGADGQLAAYDDGYIGYGLAAHEQADQFVFSSPESADKFAKALRYHLAGTGATIIQNALAPVADEDEGAKLSAALESFIASPDFEAGINSSTQAGFSGSHYSVELFEDGLYRVLWAGQIGNLYESPGVILPIPQIPDEDADDEDAAGFYANKFAQELRDDLAEELDQRSAALETSNR